MEHQYDRPPAPSGPATTPSPYVQEYAAPAQPSRGTVFRRTTRLLFRRLLYGFAVVGRALRPFAALLVIIIALLGVVGWMSFKLWAPAVGQVADTRETLLPPSESVQNYIQGQQSYNADMMWNSLSYASQAAQFEGGASKQTLATHIQKKKDGGVQFTKYKYIGGTKADGVTMYFYAVDVAVSSQRGTLPMTILTDADGKVQNVIGAELLSDLGSPQASEQ